MNLKGLLKHRNAIYGVLAIWIVLFHINRRLGNVMTVPVLSQIISCGNMGVDIFMLFSGCCLYLSLDKKPDVMTFYNRRFIRIIPAYLLITVPFWFWRSLIEAPMASGNFHFIRFFADLSSASFWFTGIETTWFVAAIVVFYLLFPMIYKIIKKGNEQTFILLAVTYALNIIAIEFIPLYNKSSIAWTRLPVFVIGAIFGKYIDSIDLERLDSKPRYILIGGGFYP